MAWWPEGMVWMPDEMNKLAHDLAQSIIFEGRWNVCDALLLLNWCDDHKSCKVYTHKNRFCTLHYCGRCSNIIGKGDKYCSQCGRELRWEWLNSLYTVRTAGCFKRPAIICYSVIGLPGVKAIPYCSMGSCQIRKNSRYFRKNLWTYIRIWGIRVSVSHRRIMKSICRETIIRIIWHYMPDAWSVIQIIYGKEASRLNEDW